MLIIYNFLRSFTISVSDFCCLFEQAQQLFQRDAQTITPEALESVKAALASSEIEHKAETKKKALPRKAAGQAWEDPTLAEWPESRNPFNRIHFSIQNKSHAFSF